MSTLGVSNAKVLTHLVIVSSGLWPSRNTVESPTIELASERREFAVFEVLRHDI